jgi:hypothetical protein
MLNFHF